MTDNMHMEEAAWQRCRNERQLIWSGKQCQTYFKGPLASWAGENISKKAGIEPTECSWAQTKGHSVWMSHDLGSHSWHAVAGVCCGTPAVDVCLTSLGLRPRGLQLDTKLDTRVIWGKAELNFCHKEYDTGDFEDISDDGQDNWTEIGPVFSHPGSLAMDFLSYMVNVTKYHKSL